MDVELNTIFYQIFIFSLMFFVLMFKVPFLSIVCRRTRDCLGSHKLLLIFASREIFRVRGRIPIGLGPERFLTGRYHPFVAIK